MPWTVVAWSGRNVEAGITAFPVHPGWVRSRLGRGFPWILRAIFGPVLLLLAPVIHTINPIDGAQTTLHCLLSEEALAQSGVYHAQTGGPKHRNGERGGWPLPSPNPIANDVTAAERLWGVTVEMIAEIKAATSIPHPDPQKSRS